MKSNIIHFSNNFCPPSWCGLFILEIVAKHRFVPKQPHVPGQASSTFTAALYNNRPWNLFPLRGKKRTRPKKEKRLGIVSSYVTWMSNNFGARGCRISNVEAGLSSGLGSESSSSLGLELCDAAATTVSPYLLAAAASL